MMKSSGMPLAQAQEMASALVELLQPATQRIQIAGSIRRLKARPHDIEIVASPLFRHTLTPTQDTMFDGKMFHGIESETLNLLDVRCDALLSTGYLEKRPDKNSRFCWGSGIKRAIFYHERGYAACDIFGVIEPATWGVIFAIRTGPGEFNKLLVTSQFFGGACPKNRKVAGGRVWNIGAYAPGYRRDLAAMAASKFIKRVGDGPDDLQDVAELPTSAERDFFDALDVPYWEPHQRTPERLRQWLAEAKLKQHIRAME